MKHASSSRPFQTAETQEDDLEYLTLAGTVTVDQADDSPDEDEDDHSEQEAAEDEIDDLHEDEEEDEDEDEQESEEEDDLLDDSAADVEDDTIAGSEDDDCLNGGAGDDTLVLGATRNDYTFTPLRHGYVHARGPEGHDTFKNIEKVSFSDGTSTTVDTLGDSHVSTEESQVAELYVALFGRAPEHAGLGYWVSELARGKTLDCIADEMYHCEPARAHYPLAIGNDEFVSKVYSQVLGRTPDSGGLSYWMDKLEGGECSRAALIIDMINAVKDYAGTDNAAVAAQNYFLNRVTVAEYYGAIREEDDSELAESLLAGVDDSEESVASALACIDEIDDATLSPDDENEDVIELELATSLDTSSALDQSLLGIDGENGTATAQITYDLGMM